MNKPKFTVEIYHDIAAHLAGISEKEFFTEPEKLIKAWKYATDWTLETFKGRLKPRVPSAAPLSYGHLACLGAPIKYSESAEPNVLPATRDIDEAIRMLKDMRSIDFTECPIFKRYKEVSDQVRSVYPNAPIVGGLFFEGPLTSAALYLGEDFYGYILEEPEKTREFLELMTKSILEFKYQVNRFCGEPEKHPVIGRLPDDIASMVPPRLWESFVLPYWKMYYEGATTTKSRFLHCESLTPEQLPYIKQAGVTFYQPSVSPRLSLKDLSASGLTFDWLIYAFDIPHLSDTELEARMRAAMNAGASNIRTQFGAYAIKNGYIDRIIAFMDIGDRLLNE